MATKEELKKEFEEAFDDTGKKEEAARALTTQTDAALVAWGDRETVIATGIRIKTMLPGGEKLSIPQALAAGQYAVATGLNPFRGEFYAFPDKKGNLNIVDGYKALTRWAEDECPFDVQYRPQNPGPGEAYNVKCIIMRHDRRAMLDYYLEKGADFQTAFDLVTTSKVGVVMANETKWPDGNAKDPPHGWTWEQVAEKRALKNALNFSHGMPTVAELARKSWEVAGVLTKPEDWDGTDNLKTQEEKERLASMQARERERKDQWATMTPEEQATKVKANSILLYGDDEDDPFGDVIDGEVVTEAMTLYQALSMPLPKAAPKLGLEKGDPLSEAVKKDARELIDYLARPSSYASPTAEDMRTQEAASTIMASWTDARAIMEEPAEELGEPIEVEGDALSLF